MIHAVPDEILLGAVNKLEQKIGRDLRSTEIPIVIDIIEQYMLDEKDERFVQEYLSRYLDYVFDYKDIIELAEIEESTEDVI